MKTHINLTMLAGLIAAVALGYLAGQPRAQAQYGGGGGAVTVSATQANGGSHAWAVDPRTSQVILCATDAMATKITCRSAPMPGSAMR